MVLGLFWRRRRIVIGFLAPRVSFPKWGGGVFLVGVPIMRTIVSWGILQKKGVPPILRDAFSLYSTALGSFWAKVWQDLLTGLFTRGSSWLL